MPDRLSLNPYEAHVILNIAAALEDGRVSADAPSFTPRSLGRVLSVDGDVVAAVLDRLSVFQHGRGARPYHRSMSALTEAVERHLPEAETMASLYETEEEQVARLREELEALRPGWNPHPPAETDSLDSVGDVTLGGLTFTG